MAPEYAMDGTLSFMQDVYSFGVLLLEIISGRRNHRGFNLIAHVSNVFPFYILLIHINFSSDIND
jgi:hypothetical protein